MSETTATTGETPAATQAQAAQPEAKPETWKDGEPFDAKKAQELIEKLRGETKALKDKAKKADEYEAELTKRKEAEMSELEKLTKKLQDAERKAADLERQTQQRQAAEEVGLPAAFANRIQGATLDEMKADAKALLDAMPKPAQTQNQPADNKKTPPQIPPSNPAQNAGAETDAQRRARLGIGRG